MLQNSITNVFKRIASNNAMMLALTHSLRGFVFFVLANFFLSQIIVTKLLNYL
jgi:hypothetical protein